MNPSKTIDRFDRFHKLVESLKVFEHNSVLNVMKCEGYLKKFDDLLKKHGEEFGLGEASGLAAMVDDKGNTLLHKAIEKMNVNVIVAVLKFFLENLDVQNNFGQTPLCIAAKNNNVDAVHMLVILGANSLLKDSNYKSPIDYCDSSKCARINAALKNPELISEFYRDGKMSLPGIDDSLRALFDLLQVPNNDNVKNTDGTIVGSSVFLNPVNFLFPSISSVSGVSPQGVSFSSSGYSQASVYSDNGIKDVTRKDYRMSFAREDSLVSIRSGSPDDSTFDFSMFNPQKAPVKNVSLRLPSIVVDACKDHKLSF